MGVKYSPTTREKLVIHMLKNDKRVTSKQALKVVSTPGYLYQIVNSLVNRKPHAMIKVRIGENDKRTRIYELTNAGEDYAFKVNSLWEVEGRDSCRIV